MPSVKIMGMGRYLPRNKVLSSELDAKLQRAEGSVQKSQVLFHGISLLRMKPPPIWEHKPPALQ